jgi:hypothetical protein
MLDNIRKIIREELSELNSGEIICYHRSNSVEHMMAGDFRMDYADDVALFGHAIYFSESPNISQQHGKYLCKFGIKLQGPVLDMNTRIDGQQQQQLQDKFNEMFSLDIDTDINDLLYPNVQIGDFFDEISDQYDWDLNKHYHKFIRSLGYNSFRYFGDYHTDFVNKKGDYGSCYGVYEPKDIRFIDGPF